MVTSSSRTYLLGVFFLYLTLSSEAIALKRKVDEAVNTERYLESHMFGDGMGGLTPEQQTRGVSLYQCAHRVCDSADRSAV